MTHCRTNHLLRRVVLAGLVLTAHLISAAPAWASDPPLDDQWMTLQQQSREALAVLTRLGGGQVDAGHGGPAAPGGAGHGSPAAPGGAGHGSPAAPGGAGFVVVGFTGGRERADSRASGVVRLRRQIEQSMPGRDDVVVLTYNNRDWSMAADAVEARTRNTPRGASATAVASGVRQRPLVVVFGHSWGGGAITKFARQLGAHDIDVALAVYVDAFSMRNPRVPANVHFAVNLYQRSGIFRGLPLRGKSRLVVEDPAATTVLANLQIKPQTDRYFGWHWNLVQPLLYLQHHRMGHDVRLHRYLLALIEDQIEDLPPPSSAPSTFDDDSWRADEADASPASPTIGS